MRIAVAVAALVISLPAPARAERIVRNGYVESFDGTRIAYTLSLPEAGTAPIVLAGHGFGDTRTSNAAVFNFLEDAGYAVLRWDARGFGDSGGQTHVDSMDYEVRDVRALVDFASTLAEVTQDAPGDPRVGMAGGSYGGGIQLLAASADPRIDAITPLASWNALVRSLRPGGVVKTGWNAFVYAAGLGPTHADQRAGTEPARAPTLQGGYSSYLHRWALESAAGAWSSDTVEFFAARSPERYLSGATLPDGRVLPGIRAATLLVQGLPDTLFPINEALANLDAISARAVPARLMLACGGHTLNTAPVCRDGGWRAHANEAMLRWFAVHLAGSDQPEGPPIEYQTQDGSWRSADALPTTTAVAEGTATVVNGPPASGFVLWPAPAPEGTLIPLDVAEGSTVLGVPMATISSGAAADVYLKLLDVDASGRTVVIDDQVMPQRLAAGAQVQFDLGGVAWTVHPGHKVFVEVSGGSNTHAPAGAPAAADVDVRVQVPVSYTTGL